MNRLISILFLNISIFFSFGFSTQESACHHQAETNVEDNHSCCQPKSKSTCHKNENQPCNGDCCLVSTHLFDLNDFVNFKTVDAPYIIFETIQKLNIDAPIFDESLVDKKLADYYSFKSSSGRQIILLKQSWII
ncbi:MAG: hypothetical protein ACWA41_03485 [Putridiphycobacter sp.]